MFEKWQGKIKSKGHCKADHEGTEKKYRYSSALSLTSTPHLGHFIPEKRDPAPTAHEAGWAPGSLWTDVEYLVLTGIQSQDRTARSYCYTDCAIHGHTNDKGNMKIWQKPVAYSYKLSAVVIVWIAVFRVRTPRAVVGGCRCHGRTR
jgi:hypothetical protein